MKKYSKNAIASLVLITSTAMAVSCKKDDDKAEPAAASTALANSTNPGAAITEISAAMGSLALTLPSLRLAGIATDYCTANGDPIKDGAAITSNAEQTYAPALGFCQATFNAQSQDTARGALYLAGGIACEMGVANLFDGLAAGASTTETITVDFGTDCWGTQAEADAFKADTGAASLDLPVTVEKLADTAAYDFKISFAIGEGQNIELMTKSSDGIRAARMTETSEQGNSAFAVTLDGSNLAEAKIAYETISLQHEGRIRVLIEGAMGTDFAFTSIDSVKGFDLRGQENGDAVTLVTFSGDTTNGFVGASYSNVATSDGSTSCYLPGSSSPTCTASVISSSLEAAQALMTSSSAAYDTLSVLDTTIDFSDIDPTDHDVTQ